MPRVLDDPPDPRTALFWNGTAWQWALVDAAGHLQIDTITSGLPAGAATAANQALILAQLQLIEDIRNALQSVDTDALQVRGEDQLVSISAGLWSLRTAVISGANGFVDSNPVGAGEYWKVTVICCFDSTTANTLHYWSVVHDGTPYWIGEERVAFAIAQRDNWRGEVWLDAEDFIRCNFVGGLAGDSCTVVLCGHRMTVE